MQSPVSLLTTDVANKSLDALWERANVISNNIANADTPGFKEQAVTFEDTLAQALGGGTLTQSVVNAVSPQVTTVLGTEDSTGNSVDMDSQMVELARNQLQYSYMEKGLSAQLTMLQSAASDGRSS